MINLFQSLVPRITHRLAIHHHRYPPVKAKDAYWEFILCDAIEYGHPEEKPQWKCGSQQIGRDITLNDGHGISCKSGQIHPDGRIKFSSSTLSRLSHGVEKKEALEKIKHYLSTSKTEDYIVCLSTKIGKTPRFDGQPQYLYSIYDADVLNCKNMEWELFGKYDDLKGCCHTSGVMVTCTEAMCYQVWYHLPIDLALYSIEITPIGRPVSMNLPVYRRPLKQAADHLFSFS